MKKWNDFDAWLKGKFTKTLFAKDCKKYNIKPDAYNHITEFISYGETLYRYKFIGFTHEPKVGWLDDCICLWVDLDSMELLGIRLDETKRYLKYDKLLYSEM